jgi:hypothetical protein
VKPRVRAISDGNVEAVLKELEEENDKNPNKRLKRLIGYINRFYDALDYDKYKSLGYPIGSGEIESAHKSIPQKRLKIPGGKLECLFDRPYVGFTHFKSQRLVGRFLESTG